ncbi:MAG: hypothetical protein H6741_27470 [Alphaproteobacteria bacterium]|nr:hypothetical protein [Alphaproteobacteria bacterium]MCB9796453.1 hypothetical protein [Alphaproteobacteria bacterium]
MSERITLFADRAPPLPVGRYTLRVESEARVDGVVQGEREVSDFVLVVEGPRFVLPAESVRGRHPAPGVSGDFGAELPMALLSPATLPWQRSAGEGAPWLALLLLHPGEPELEVNREAGIVDLQSPPERVFHPPLVESLAPTAERFAIVDVPVALFNALAPTLEDLALLAHARRGELDDKAISNLADEPPMEGSEDVAVVLGSRLPAAPEGGAAHAPGEVPIGARNRAFLVSLEGFGEDLPVEREGALHPGVDPARYDFVRLVTLSDWEFFTEPSRQHSFKEVLGAVDAGPLRAPPVASADAEAALARGFVALPHHTRRADLLPSWYRGPLLPGPSNEAGPPPLLSAADEALRYDPQRGMFDASLAAAWQLGRLLALHDKSVAKAILAWRQGKLRRSRAALRLRALTETLSLSATPEGGLLSALTERLVSGLERHLEADDE